MGGESRLAEMDLDQVGQDHSLKVCTQEPFNRTHENHRDVLLEETHKPSLNIGILQEVNQIIHIESKSEGIRGWGGCGAGGVNNITAEEAGVVCILVEAELE